MNIINSLKEELAKLKLLNSKHIKASSPELIKWLNEQINWLSNYRKQLKQRIKTLNKDYNWQYFRILLQHKDIIKKELLHLNEKELASEIDSVRIPEQLIKIFKNAYKRAKPKLKSMQKLYKEEITLANKEVIAGKRILVMVEKMMSDNPRLEQLLADEFNKAYAIKDNTSYSYMQMFKQYAYKLGASALLALTLARPVTADDVKQVAVADQSVKKIATTTQNIEQKLTITDEEIKKYMAMLYVDKILADNYKDGSIVHLKYDINNPEKSFDELRKEIYQYDVDKKLRKPVLVLFYDNDFEGTKGDYCTIREAIIFKKLVEKYGDKIKFIAFDAPTTETNDTKDAYYMLYIKRVKDLPRIRGPPSISMFAPYDVVKGETPEKNDGIVKHIDTLYGGPKDDVWLKIWMKNINKYWLPTNIFPNGEYCWLSLIHI